ncbi:alpha/beta hydrolase [Alphaproteobacteria bacterium]|nr:alpha/beta hydrolase [Alphaproteobacteria bacterium]
MSISYDEKFLTSQDGLKLYFRDYKNDFSKKKPIICLPGMTRNSKDFHEFAETFVKDRRIICPDLRGRGKSDYDKNVKNYWLPYKYTSDVLSIMTASSISEAYFVGTSLGGLLAMQMAVVRPSSICGIVLNDIGPELPINAVNRISNQSSKSKGFNSWDEAMKYLKENFKNTHPKISDLKWLNLAKKNFQEKDGLIQTDYDIKIINNLKKNSTKQNLWILYESIKKIPTLLIKGALSDILTNQILNKMVSLKDDLEITEIDFCGHNPFLDEKEAISSIKLFFQQNDNN